MGAADRIDAVTSELSQAGARIVTAVPLADPADPHVVVAHDVRVSSATPAIHAEATAILRAHRVPIVGLVPWRDATIDEEVDDESISR